MSGSRWDQPGVPHKGWHCLDVVDLRADGGLADETDYASIDDAHLDHAWPNFSHIVSGFRAARGWSGDVPDGIVFAPADGQTTPTFVDKAVADAFRDYHHNQAMLRILSKSANLQTASQARRPKIARPVRLA